MNEILVSFGQEGFQKKQILESFDDFFFIRGVIDHIHIFLNLNVIP
jgi:hypothetical protein